MNLFNIIGWGLFALILVLVIASKVTLVRRRRKLDGIQEDIGKSGRLEFDDDATDEWPEV